MLPKLLMNGIKLESEAPTQEQVAHQQDIPYKVKYRYKFMKCCTWINWFYFSRFWPFFRFCSLKTLPKIEFKTSDMYNSYKPIKSHWLGNATRSVQKVKFKYGCKNCEKDEFGLCWLYFQNLHLFSPLLAYKLLPNTT